MVQALSVIHLLVALSIIGMVLLQQGKGADAGTGLGGGGGSGSLFGARGAASFLSRTTAILAVVFFSTSLVLAYLSGKTDNKPVDIMDTPAATTPADMPSVKTGKPAAAGDMPGTSDVPAAH